MSLYNAAKYEKQLAEKQKIIDQYYSMERRRNRVLNKNRQLVDKYRNRVANFVKDVLDFDAVPTEDGEIEDVPSQ